jgi:hypothetical protein
VSPIRPSERARYPADWPAVVARIRQRSGNRCECSGQCGLDHGDRCTAQQGQPHPDTGAVVVLTTMHLDHTPEHCGDENLLHACQRCHNRYDAPVRRAGRRARGPQLIIEGL